MVVKSTVQQIDQWLNITLLCNGKLNFHISFYIVFYINIENVDVLGIFNKKPHFN